MTPAIFLDRDGVINKDYGYVHKIDNFEYIAGVFKACIEFKKMGYKIVVITNQSGIARGIFNEDEFLNLTEWMDWNFLDNGVELDGIYYCPHLDSGTVEKYSLICDCRKPKPGLILTAAKDLNINLTNSILIGDKLSDIDAGIAAGIKECILVRSGHKIITEGNATMVLNSIADAPSYIRKIQL